MNKNFSNIVLSLSAIFALNACSTNSDYKAKDNSKRENPRVEKKGLEGRVISSSLVKSAKVCFDKNKDGLCQDEEDFVISDKDGFYSFKKEISNRNLNSLLIAQIKDNENIKYVLSSEQISKENQNITPFTTLVVNENKYNLLVKNNKANANDYLISKLKNLDNKLLNGSNYLSKSDILKNAEKLLSSYKKAYSLKASEPLLTIASVVDELVKQNKYDVQISSIDSQKIDGGEVIVEDKFKIKDLSESVSWKKDYKDETVIGNTVSKDKFISYSKWHNKLVIINTSEKAPVLVENKKFLNVKGERYDEDSVSGASEQVLSKVEVSNDGNTVYSLVKKYEESSSNKGVGLYKTDISSGIPKINFSRVPVGSSFYNKDFTDISLSKDNTQLLASSNDKEIYLFDTLNLTNPKSIIKTEKTAKSILFDKSKSYAFVGFYKRKANSFGIYDLVKDKLLGEYKTTNTPTLIAQLNDSTIFIANNMENKVYKLDITDKSNIVLKETFETSNYIKALNISKDSKHLIVSTANKKVVVFDAENKKRNDTISLTNNVTNAFELENNKIIVNHGEFLSSYSLSDEKGKVSDTTISSWIEKHRGNK